MDHNKPTFNASGARPNRRASTQLTIDHEGRKPLFARGSRASLGPQDLAQAASDANRFGFSPTSHNPPPRPSSRAASIGRPSSSLSQTPSIASNHSAEILSPGSRIPRPTSTQLLFPKNSDSAVARAWKLAGADGDIVHTLERSRRVSTAAIDASPSPAPRFGRQTSDESAARQPLGRDAVDYSRPRPQSRLSMESLRESYIPRLAGSPASQHSSNSNSSASFDRRLSQYEREMEQSPGGARNPDIFLGSTRIGPKIAETGHTLARKTSNSSLNRGVGLARKTSNSSINSGHSLGRRTSQGSLNGSPRTGTVAFAKGSVPPGAIKQFWQQDDKSDKRSSMSRSDWEAAADTPLSSVESGLPPQEPTPPTSRPASVKPETRSPDKSYAWQFDADFTAGDLQVSDSPRIRMSGTAFGDAPDQTPRSDKPYADNQDFRGTPESNEASPWKSSSRTARSNTRIDEIRRREEKANEQKVNEQIADAQRSVSRARNTRLEEIREKEAEAEEELARQRRAQPRTYYPTPDDLPLRDQAEDLAITVSAKEQPRPKNTKLDEIRAREAESMSKRAVASSRLEEIREQNSLMRSESPEARLSDELVRESTIVKKADGSPSGEPLEEEGERTRSPPVAIYHQSLVDKGSKTRPEPTEASPEVFISPKSPGIQVTHARTESRDLLQRLARATSSSPAPEPQVQPAAAEKVQTAPENQQKTTGQHDDNRTRQHRREGSLQQGDGISEQQREDKTGEEKYEKPVDEPVKRTDFRHRRSLPEEKPADREKKPDAPRLDDHTDLAVAQLLSKAEEPQTSPKDNPIVSESERPKSAASSAGRRRERRQRSTDSAKDGRKSLAMSDGDPTDRIEQEMKLFAPTDNQSERGSVRAPSAEPLTEDEDKDLLADETPRPAKVDPLSLPTPRVTGAYIETPATVRVERFEEEVKPAAQSVSNPATSQSRPPSRRGPRPMLRRKSSSKVSESSSETSESKEHEKEDAGTTTTSNLRRRNRSASRSRRPLINSVKPPTVKDDLLELQRLHQIEDSTLDDFEEMFSAQNLQNTPSDAIESMLDEISAKREEIASKPGLPTTERDRELEQYDRMRKTLNDAHRNIRTAKQGIERLEDKVSHAEGKQEGDVSTKENRNESEKPQKQQQHEHKSHNYDHKHPDHAKNCPSCIGKVPPKEVSYLHLPVPSLYRRRPFRFTLIGLLLLLAGLWYAAESAMCEVYCRPATCSSSPCVWSKTDPTWGYAIPVKFDEWTTGGWGRQIADQVSEDASDLFADAMDFFTGTDITSIDINALDFYGKRQHRRRLRKKGLLKRPTESTEDKAKWNAWHAARMANERVRDAREMGYDISEADESMGDDEML
ncbi:hypothetical protein CCHL11_02110 [Colletotrichum chlorophyti]|uniref:Uncharacterized protein n=1 Tax=Colletotrichum chlorophyti TaxID=708187 RepID=A0A1Q8S6V1_9PEZI|nr:hypothetical protein CCHL11_02110 [Colletotrichum chlorophyti]